jgi:predicted alpha-1,2-mannosidase
MIGTGGTGFSVGNSYPGAARPLGLVKASPDTADALGLAYGAQRGGGYHYDDVFIQGFSHLHLQGVGLTDYGLVSLMPLDGIPAKRTSPDTYMAPFSHDREEARPGRYSVVLEEPEIHVEITATDHTALHRYTFSEEVSEPVVLIDPSKLMGTSRLLAASVRVFPEEGRVTGLVRQNGEMSAPFTTWFAMEVQPIPTSWGTWSDEGLASGDAVEQSSVFVEEGELEAERIGAWLGFDTHEVHLRVALSTVDAQGALRNLELEHNGFDLEAEEEAAWDAWAQALGDVRIRGGSEAEQVQFASALYRCLLMPNLFSDADGRYRGFDGSVHASTGHRYFTDFSLWDTYRSTHPLYTLIWPQEHREMLRSMARMAEQGGNLPRWPLAIWDGGFMVGSPAQIVVAEAAIKGLGDFEQEALIQVAVDDALGRTEPDYAGRPDIELYESTTYYPADEVGSSVSWTQEVALADHALSLVASNSKDRAWLGERAGWWRNLYDDEVGFFHGRNADGSFTELVSDGAWLDEFSEGNARQYLWGVPHDPEGLFELLGGEAIAVDRLSEFFENAVTDDTLDWLPQSWFWAGNEHDIHTPWLFALAGRPDLTREWVSWTANTHYSDQADGLPGNDDGGTLSAWYAWAAMGLYPLAGTDRYVLGRPFFEQIELPGPGGGLLIKRCPAGELGAILLDGEALSEPELRHEDLFCASVLEFTCASANP